jgi:hypothetical protein
MWCRIPAVNSVRLSVSFCYHFYTSQSFLLSSPSTAITVELPWDISEISLFRNYPTDVPNAMFSDNQRCPLGTPVRTIRVRNVQRLFIYNVLQQREVNTGICVYIPSVFKCFNKLQKWVPHTKTGRKSRVSKQYSRYSRTLILWSLSVETLETLLHWATI